MGLIEWVQFNKASDNMEQTKTTMQTIRICPITAAEDAAMAALVRENLKAVGLDIPGTAYFDPELESLSRFYAGRPERRTYYVALDAGGRVLGGAGLAEFEGIADCAELQKLYMAEAAKRNGIATRLVQQVEWRARELGYRKLYLETHSSLVPALRLYEKLGFACVEPPCAVQHGTMDRFYIKEL